MLAVKNVLCKEVEKVEWREWGRTEQIKSRERSIEEHYSSKRQSNKCSKRKCSRISLRNRKTEEKSCGSWNWDSWSRWPKFVEKL